MLARLTVIAAVLAFSTSLAMSQELDPGETLQARSLAAQAQSAADKAAARDRVAAAAPQARPARSHKRSDWSHLYDRHPRQAPEQLAHAG